MRKVILITGASRGIGRQCAIRLSKENDVIINYLNSERYAKEVLDILKSNKSKATMIKADVRIRSQVNNMIDTIIEKYSKIDVLINNAGIAKQSLFSDVSQDEWQDMLNVTLNGAFNCTQEVLKHMIREKRGKIINISSMWGVTGASMEVPYSCAKAGLIGFTKALAKEVAPSNITVNAVAPGVVKTDMCDFDKETLDLLKEEIPLGYIASTDDIAKTVEFLSGDKSDYITGEVINVNGGFVI